ncbi:hypothetical protein [Mesorhizobium sp. M0589]|uniref:hypothetical protein n=1 Tax=Mesorhizobium sp. M0589 TaxID=2956965 RepID=UPI00333C6AD5
MGRTLVAQSEYRDLVKRHEAVTSLINRAAADITETEQRAAGATPAMASRLTLQLVNKRKFLGILETRLSVLAAELSEHEREQEAILRRLSGRHLP